jgi:hypothetical protein
MALRKDSFQTLFVIQSTKKRLDKYAKKNLTKVLNKLKNCLFNRYFNLLQIHSNNIFIPFNRFHGYFARKGVLAIQLRIKMATDFQIPDQ